jgi:glycosyltransferase 2 family protein
MTPQKRRYLILIGVLISVFFLYISLRGTNFHEVGGALTRASYRWVIPMLAAYCLYYWIKAIRWRMLLQPMVETRAVEIFSPMMIGFTFNNILPAHLGEFVRMYLGARQLRLEKTQVLATIVLERVFDMLAVIFFFALALMVAENVNPTLIESGYWIAGGGGLFLVTVVIYIVWTDAFLRLLRQMTFFVPRLGRCRGLGFLESGREAVFHQLEIGVEGLQALKRPGLCLGIITTSIAQWGCMGLAAYMAMIAVGVDVQISGAFVVLAATTFFVTLPAAPGFLGSIQAAFNLALVPYGVSVADAFAASAFFHVPTYLIVTLPGLWMLKRTGYRFKQIREEAEAAAAPENAER